MDHAEDHRRVTSIAAPGLGAWCDECGEDWPCSIGRLREERDDLRARVEALTAARDAGARVTLAYLMWCFSEGYLIPEDRAVGGGNWMLLPDDQLHPDDIATRDGLLSMADEILVALAAEVST